MDAAKAFVSVLFAAQPEAADSVNANLATDTNLSLALIIGAVAVACVVWILFQTTSWIAARIGQVLFIWASMATFLVCKDMLAYGVPAYNLASLISNLTNSFVGLRGAVG